MATGSILLAILSFACAGLGFLTTPIPGLGAVFSFAAPVLAIAGSITGGVAMSRAKRDAKSTDVARTGVILSAIAFVPALFIALFCGVCNALCATGDVHMQRRVSFGVDPNQGGSPNAGAQALPPPPLAGAPAATTGSPAPSQPAAPSAPSLSAPAQPNAAPAPAFPPPPLPAGPGAQPRRN